MAPRGQEQRGASRERGAALAEFALVSLLLWLLVAGVLELGRAFAAQQVLQNAASAAARDLALVALPANSGFLDPNTGGSGPGRNAIFDEGFLVADAALLASCPTGTSTDTAPGLSLAAVRSYFAAHGAPVLNRLLLPLWIRDVVDGVEVLRYPGAVLRRDAAIGGCDDGSAYTVRIPELVEGGGVEWREVVEPLEMPDDASGDTYPRDDFPLADGGWAAIRVLYPFQAVGLQGWRSGAGGGQRMIDAVDPTQAPPPGLSFVSTPESGAYAGSYGLGVLYAWGREVRPYRRVLAASAAFRREVFEVEP